MKNHRGLLIIFLLAIVALTAALADIAQKKQNRVCFSSRCFFVETAKTAQERERGLMFRNHLAKDRGMLFIFDQEGEYSFWMKNTFIPLDIIWLNAENEVVFIEKNAQPCLQIDCPVITPSQKANFVLELSGGTADKIGLNVGDRALRLVDR